MFSDGKRVMGLLTFAILILAIMVAWNFLIRAWVAKRPDSPARQGLALDV